MTDTITLPPVSMADLDAILDLVAAVRWPHRHADIAALIELGHGRTVRDETDGRTVAVGLWWPFGEASARLGLVIVAPDSQGRGIGRRLVQALLTDAAPRSVMLLATTAGRPLYDTLGWACATYYDRPAEFKAMRLRGMRQDFSWRRSAERYVDLYRWAVAARTGAPA